MYKPSQLKVLKQQQRRMLQQAGLEKEYRKLQRRIKKEMQGAEIYIYKDITPSSLGEFVFVLTIMREDDILAQVQGMDLEDLLETTEEWINE